LYTIAYIRCQTLKTLTTKKFPSLVNYFFPEQLVTWMIPNTVTGGKIEIINITIRIRATHTQTKQSNLLNFTNFNN